MLNNQIKVESFFSFFINYFLSNNVAFSMMLLSIKIAAMFGDLSRIGLLSLLMVHMGFFLLWQPIVDQKNSLSLQKMVAIIIVLLAFFFTGSWWIISCWLLIIIGMMAGKLHESRLNCIIDIIGISLVFCFLLLEIIPEKLLNITIFIVEIERVYDVIFLFSLAGLFFFAREKNKHHKLDYTLGFFAIIGISVLCMIIMLFFYSFQLDYLKSVFFSIIFIAFFILFSEMFLNVGQTNSGIKQLWLRYVFYSGIKYEDWTTYLTELASNKKIQPDEFLFQSIDHIVKELPVAGIKIFIEDKKTPSITYQLISESGVLSQNELKIKERDICAIVYAHTPFGAVSGLHYQLLIRMVLLLYFSKEREQQLRQQSHLKAVYETGSKLTHDVKNILQSIYAMIQIVKIEQVGLDEIRLMQRQLPLLAQRLQVTLDKFKVPNKVEDEIQKKQIEQWWAEIKERLSDRNIIFHKEIEGKIKNNYLIFDEVLDTIFDNLIENARYKRMNDPGILIVVSLEVGETYFHVMVKDTGGIIPHDIERYLFKEMLSSKEGFGIGLLQSYRLALKNNYQLSLVCNEAGNVCFMISSHSNQI